MKDLKQRVNEIGDLRSELIEFLKTKNGVVLFEEKDLYDEDENIDLEKAEDYPVAFYVGKHMEYYEGIIRKINKNTITLYCLFEEMGEEYELDLDWLTLDTLIDIYNFIEE